MRTLAEQLAGEPRLATPEQRRRIERLCARLGLPPRESRALVDGAETIEEADWLIHDLGCALYSRWRRLG